MQEKAAAQAEYQAAMQRRQTAILLEETTPDIFQIKVGHLSPGAGAKVGIHQCRPQSFHKSDDVGDADLPL